MHTVSLLCRAGISATHVLAIRFHFSKHSDVAAQVTTAAERQVVYPTGNYKKIFVCLCTVTFHWQIPKYTSTLRLQWVAGSVGHHTDAR
jgi:hypothetical protein